MFCDKYQSTRAPYIRLILLLLMLLVPTGLRAQQAPGRLVPLEDLECAPMGALARRITLHAERMPLQNVLREIGRQAGISIVFDTDLIAAQSPRTLDLTSVTVVSAVRSALRGTPLAGYYSPEGTIIIARATPESGTTVQADPLPVPVPQGQTVRGRVVDRASKMPLPGANVIVVGTDPLQGATTDAEGRFVIPHVSFGRHTFQASYVGYESLVLPELLVTSSKELDLDIQLSEQVVAAREIVISTEVRKDLPMNDMALVGARSFSVEETRRYAGGVDDPARMASSFAGVAAGVGVQDNSLVIRGNAPKGVLWRLEGIEIPNPSHFAGMTVTGGGGLTLFSSQLLTDSDFFTGAFPAEYGNALAGVFDMQFRSGNPSRREHALQLGVMGIDLSSEGPFREGASSSYLFNYRYSTIALLMPILPTEDVARYQDLSFKLAFPTRKSGRFELWGIGGLDGQKMSIEQDSSKWEYNTWDRLAFDLGLGVGATGLSHTLPIDARTYIRSSLAATINRTRLDQQRIGDNLAVDDNVFLNSTSGRFVASSFINHKFSARHTNRTGITAQRLFYDLDLQVAIDDRPPMIPVANGSGASMLVQAYTQSRFDLSRALSLNAGVHSQYFALTGKYTVEPRASLRLQTSAAQAFSLGYGLHSQIEEMRFYLISQDGQQPNRKLDYAKAHHFMAGYDRRIGSAARLKLEGFYQELFDVPVVADSSFSMLNFEQDWAFNSPLVNTGKGRNYGVELTMERFLKDGYYYLLTGSIFDSRYRGGDGTWRPTRYDRGYTGSILFGKEFAFGDRSNLLGINGRLVFDGGRRRSPVDVAASLARESVVLDEHRAFSDREPSVFVLDATLTYRRNHRRLSEVWALQVKNALLAKDVTREYNFLTDSIEEVKEGYPLPVLSYKIEF